VEITWLGHAAFLVEGDGLRVVLDPYRSPDCGGFAPVNVAADVVAVSHENDRYHSHLGQIQGTFDVVRGLEITKGGQTARGVRFEAIPCFESPEKLPGDEVTILHFRLEGRHIVHIGDLGHALVEAEVAPLRGADVLLFAAGGPPTIDFPLMADLITDIAPRVVIPMHYLVPGKIDLPIQPVERFLEAIPPQWTVKRSEGSTLVVAPGESLPPGPTIHVLQPAR
jgi:L-ascorbate metabolism protein UlaG (beta-lactamase superfamily)